MNLTLPETLSVYIHWPFCLAKCPYCDFNSHVRDSIDNAAWENALLKELDFYLKEAGERKVTTVFFGGGTPSLMHLKTVEKLLQKLNLERDAEVTLEANPTSVEAGKFRGFRDAGVNRVSLGIQSLNENSLKFLGRKHSANEAIKAAEIAAGIFPRHSVDFIYALPSQTTESWLAELEEAMNLAGGHISLYQLTIEPNTNFSHLYNAGKLELPDDETRGEMYEETTSFLAGKGFSRYEVSNYAKAGGESRHNLAYWRYDDYIGIGPGAHGRFISCGERLESFNMKSPEKWLDQVTAKKHGAEILKPVSPDVASLECALMGLRVKEGINFQAFKAKTGMRFDEVSNQQKINLFAELGLIERNQNNLKATDKGFLVLDKITSEILS